MTKSKAAAIAAGLPVLEETPLPPPEPKTEPEVEQPKRRTRSEALAKAPPPSPENPPPSSALSAEGSPKPPVDRYEKKGADLSLGSGYDRIVTNLFQLQDPMRVYDEVRAALRLGNASAASYGQLVNALDEAEENAMRAAEVLVNAKDAHAGFEIDAKIILSSLRSAASDVLEDQKAKKLITKTITNDDIEAVMAANHPDEWQDIEQRRGRAKLMVDLLSSLHEAARERAKDLRAMVSKFRGDS